MMKSLKIGPRTKALFETSQGRDLIPAVFEPSAEVVFVEAGLKAAQHSHRDVRESVLFDVSKVLNCQPEDLNFLFETEQMDVQGFDLPDADRRRQIIKNNDVWDAAE